MGLSVDVLDVALLSIEDNQQNRQKHKAENYNNQFFRSHLISFTKLFVRTVFDTRDFDFLQQFALPNHYFRNFTIFSSDFFA